MLLLPSLLLCSTPLLVLSQARKNVLFIGSDDLRPNLGMYSEVATGVLGGPAMHTPHLDKLAERSLVFERAYVQQAVCSPSRSSLMTSRRPDTTHVTDLHSWFREVGGNFTTIPQFFKNNGYTSINVGKMFHGGTDASGPGGDDNISWSEVFHARGSDTYSGNGNSWEAVAPTEKPLVDTVEAEYVVKRLAELAPEALLGEKNFFLGWGLHRPHLPFLFPEEFGDYYPEEEIKLPNNPYVPEAMPHTAWSNWGELHGGAYADATPEAVGNPYLGEINVTLPDTMTRQLRRAYYSSITYVDSEIGKVLAALEELGLAESTVIMFWGDHGWQLGEHSEWCKHTNFEVATHAPLLLSLPGATQPGLRTPALVEFVDIFPTLVEAAGFPALDLCPEMSNSSLLCTEGSSLLPLVEAPTREDWKQAVFWQYPRGGHHTEHISKIMGYTIRTDEWRYTEWVAITYLGGNNYEPDFTSQMDLPELYSMTEDPEENINVAGDPSNSEEVEKLSEQLRAGWRAARA